MNVCFLAFLCDFNVLLAGSLNCSVSENINVEFEEEDLCCFHFLQNNLSVTNDFLRCDVNSVSPISCSCAESWKIFIVCLEHLNNTEVCDCLTLNDTNRYNCRQFNFTCTECEKHVSLYIERQCSKSNSWNSSACPTAYICCGINCPKSVLPILVACWLVVSLIVIIILIIILIIIVTIVCLRRKQKGAVTPTLNLTVKYHNKNNKLEFNGCADINEFAEIPNSHGLETKTKQSKGLKSKAIDLITQNTQAHPSEDSMWQYSKIWTPLIEDVIKQDDILYSEPDLIANKGTHSIRTASSGYEVVDYERDFSSLRCGLHLSIKSEGHFNTDTIEPSESTSCSNYSLLRMERKILRNNYDALLVLGNDATSKIDTLPGHDFLHGNNTIPRTNILTKNDIIPVDDLLYKKDANYDDGLLPENYLINKEDEVTGK